ncbi:sugar phosphate isomerase/epimerase family protein [Halomonas sp. V046]|uniref:sugar phosphate isomerase/epimerase family protein n=1 Tax=Halomonas sp. V046 TaxID=3459611 RepID=UPI004044F6D1
MPRIYSLSHLTTEGLTPPQMIALAAQVGYDAVGLRLLPTTPGGMAFPLMDEAALLRDTQTAIAENGVGVFDLELVRLDDAFELERYLPFLEVGGTLGARAVLVAGDDADRSRLIDNYAALCEAARPFGLSADLEFMPWTTVSGLIHASDIVAKVAQPNATVLFDALHFDRSRSRLEDLDALPRHWLNYAQICDGPVPGPTAHAEMIRAAREERWLPGEGGIDLGAIWRRLPEDLPVSVEVPDKRRIAALGAKRWASDALAASRGLIEGL